MSNGQCSNGAKAGAPFDGVNYDSQLNSATGRNVKLKIPGASARTYSGKGVLVSMLRFMMKSRCRLGGFARSFVSLHFAGTHGAETAPTRAVFPVGLPFPEVCRRSYECCSEEAAQKRGLNAVHGDRNELSAFQQAQICDRTPATQKVECSTMGGHKMPQAQVGGLDFSFTYRAGRDG